MMDRIEQDFRVSRSPKLCDLEREQTGFQGEIRNPAGQAWLRAILGDIEEITRSKADCKNEVSLSNTSDPLSPTTHPSIV